MSTSAPLDGAFNATAERCSPLEIDRGELAYLQNNLKREVAYLKVLLTGFDAFGGESINPAWEVVKKVQEEGIEGITLIARQLPTVFGEAIRQAVEAIATDHPNLVISLGQAGGRPDISLERVALNINDASIADNQNNQPIDVPVVAGAPAAYFSTLPIKAIVEEIRNEGVPASVSNTAGTFVCNHIMYGILHHISEYRLPIKAGFIHIPYLPEQAVHHKGAPSMALADMVRALQAAIIVCVERQGETPEFC